LASQLFGGHWITFDCSFGNNEAFLERLPKDFFYLGEIACTQKVWPKACAGQPQLEQEGCTVELLLKVRGLLNWQTHRIAEGEKGPLVAAFARIRVYVSPERTPESERWLLLRNDANCEIKYALSNAPQETPMRELVRVSGARWPIERCFQEDKSDLGLDHYEPRSWTAWHRHMRLVCLAQLFPVGARPRWQSSAPTPHGHRASLRCDRIPRQVGGVAAGLAPENGNSAAPEPGYLSIVARLLPLRARAKNARWRERCSAPILPGKGESKLLALHALRDLARRVSARVRKAAANCAELSLAP
jgi:hypothetical protein